MRGVASRASSRLGPTLWPRPLHSHVSARDKPFSQPDPPACTPLLCPTFHRIYSASTAFFGTMIMMVPCFPPPTSVICCAQPFPRQGLTSHPPFLVGTVKNGPVAKGRRHRSVPRRRGETPYTEQKFMVGFPPPFSPRFAHFLLCIFLLRT